MDKQCCIDTDSFVIYIKTEDFYKDIADDIKKWFDTSEYSKNDNRLLLIGWNKKIGLFKDKLVGKILKKFIGIRAGTWEYLMDDDSEHKKVKGIKKKCNKKKTYIHCMLNDKIIVKSQQRFKSDYHNVCTDQIQKIELSSNDDQRLQTFNKITTYPCGTNALKVCECEMLSKI